MEIPIGKAISFSESYLNAEGKMNISQILTLILLLSICVGYSVSKFTITSCAVMGLLYLFRILEFKDAFGSLAADTAITFLAMFVLVAGINRTQLLNNISKQIVRIGGDNETKVMIGVTAMCALLCAFVNTTTAVITLTPVVISIANQLNKSPKRFLKSMQNNCTLFQGYLPIGQGAVEYMALNDMVEALGGRGTFELTTTFIARIPAVIICVLFNVFIMQKRAPGGVITAEATKEAEDAAASADKKSHQKKPLDPVREKLAYAIFIASMVCVIFAGKLGTDVVTVAVVGACAMVISGVLTEKEAIAAFDIRLVCMYACSQAISKALRATGLVDIIGGGLGNILGGFTNAYVIAAILFLVVGTMTQFMSNSATAAIFKPIAALAAVSLGLDARAVILAVNIAAYVSVTTPMASPSMAMTFTTGNYTMKEYVKDGLPIFILYFIIFLAWVPTVFPAL